MSKLWYILIFSFNPKGTEVHTSKDGDSAWVNEEKAKTELKKARKKVREKIKKREMTEETFVHLARQVDCYGP